ncbi:FtsK/SpoIIIE domain-containing protein [Streptomyces mayteni]
MKLIVTTADPQGRFTDHLLDLPGDATVGELATALATPRLFLDERPLDSSTPLGASGVRDGAVLGLGGPAPRPAPAVGGWLPTATDPVLVELRHVSGPGAGQVWRLGPGSYEVGTDRGCAIRLPEADPGPGAAVGETPEFAEHGVPDRDTWITVHTDGSASFRLPADADPELCGLRSLTPPPPVDPETGTPLTDEEPADRRDGGPGGHSAEPPPAGPDGLPQKPSLPPPGHRPEPDDGSRHWPRFADLSLGHHLLRLAPEFEARAAVKPAADGLSVEYSRPPRMLPHLDAENLSLPGPPAPSGPRPFPFMLMISPMVMGMAMIAIFRSFYFLILICFTPLMAMGNWLTGRRANRKCHEEQLRRYRMRRAALEREMRRATVEERHQRNIASPDPASVLLAAAGPGPQLWERRRHHGDYLTIRLGTVTRASLKKITDQARESNHRQVHWRLADVPVSVELPLLGVVGVVGPDRTTRALARWAVAQSAVLHSPRDLRIVILTDQAHTDEWTWARWLPHLRPVRPGAAGAPLVSLGNDRETTARRVNELYAEVQARSEAAGTARGREAAPGEPDILVILDGAYRLHEVPGVTNILTQGPAVRIYSLCLDDRQHLLPEQCTAVVTATDNEVALHVTGNPTVAGIRADLVDPRWCEQTARALAPVRDVTVEADAGLPAQVKLLPLLGQEPPDPAALVRAWERRPASTAFVIGAGYEGTALLDLAADGPHGLIGGTTGSGKSELLQSMIASLAAANRPDELTFVLIDYKGGAAFRECAELPHTLGMITDLDGHLTQRALASLDAELRRREQLLADVGVKDVVEYRAKRERDPELPPLPRLLLIIDEFATLVRELVEFVPGLISLAQRGRSLGLHLILATQRPAGAVSNEIRANTNLRIALRVTDRTESTDIINSPAAAAISPYTPGRALVRRGGGPPMTFQTAYVGAERPTDDDPGGSPGPRIVHGAELPLHRLGRPLPPPEVIHQANATPETADPEAADPDGAAEPPVDPPTDLTVLVDAVNAAAKALPDFTPRPRPWLPPLDDEVTLEAPDHDPHPGATRLPPFPYVLFDLPGQQDQRLGHLDFGTFGHLYVIGAPRSGRTQTLRTIAGSAALHLTTDQLHVHGIDAAGGGLTALESLPHTGAVVSRHETERLDRLIRRLMAELTRRQVLIAQADVASISELRARLPRLERPAHLLLLIDGWDALVTMLDKQDGGRTLEDLLRLLREGAAAGMHVIATSERQLLGGRAGQHNDRRLLLRQSDRMDYGVVGVNRRKVPEYLPPGRGWFTPGAIEGQVLRLPLTALAKGDDQADALRAIGRRATARDGGVADSQRPFQVARLPEVIGFQEAVDMVPDEDRRPMWALLGVAGDDGAALGYDFATGSGTFLIAGPPHSGRSTTLAAMCASLAMNGTGLVVLTPRESPLRLLAEHGLARVIDDPEPTAEALNEALEALDGKPAVVVVDDAELLVNTRVDQPLRKVASAGRDRRLGLLLAGPADGLTTMGWIGIARRGRRGLLLGPKNLTEGELIGARMTPDHMRPLTIPGRAWTGDGAGHPVAVQVPLTVLRG